MTYDRITVRLDGKRITYLMKIESDDYMAVRGIEVDRRADEIGPIILGKSSIIRRTPMDLDDGHLRPIHNPCARCRQSVPVRNKCIFCDRMVCPPCEASERHCLDCRSARIARRIANL